MRASRNLLAIVLAIAATQAGALPPEEETEHVVEAGETLNGIANRACVARDAIIAANGLEAPYVIRVGKTLTIPRKGKAASRSIPAGSGTAPGATGTYVVQPGETLGGIANREQVPRVLIAEANRLKPPYTLRVGQKLLIPRTRHHEVKPGDTGFAIAYAYGVPWNDIAVANGLDPDAQLKAGQNLLIPTVLDAPAPVQAAPQPVTATSSQFAWPVKGDIRRSYAARGSGSFHDGIDIVAPKGTAVRATAAGTVTFAGKDPKQFGNLVVLEHPDGWHSVYASLGRITVKKGASVAQGERVGLVGDTSITRKTELHFELRKDAKPVDPMSRLPKAQ